MVTIEKNKIFSQIEIYSNEIEKFETKLKNNDFEAGEREYLLDVIKKDKTLIDILLDKYNTQKVS